MGANQPAGIPSYGVVLERDTVLGSGIWETIGRVIKIGDVKIESDEEDVTSHASLGWEEIVLTIRKLGSTAVTIVWNPLDTTHLGAGSMIQDCINQIAHTYRMTRGDDAHTVKIVCKALVKSVGESMEVKTVYKQEVMLRWTGIPTTIS